MVTHRKVLHLPGRNQLSGIKCGNGEELRAGAALSASANTTRRTTEVSLLWKGLILPLLNDGKVLTVGAETGIQLRNCSTSLQAWLLQMSRAGVC